MERANENSGWSTGMNPGGIYYEHEDGFHTNFDVYLSLTHDEMLSKAIEQHQEYLNKKENKNENNLD